MAVQQAVDKWDITDKIQVLCYDTTASNTGQINGAYINLEKLLNRDLLYFPCHHHIFELVLRGCFDSLIGVTSSSDMLLFTLFREAWEKLNKKVYMTGINEAPDEIRSTILEYLGNKISKKKHPRDDYRELLELTMIFLGGISKKGILFRTPGAVSHAR